MYHPHPGARGITTTVVLVLLVIAFGMIALADAAGASPRAQAPLSTLAGASAGTDRAEAARTLRYWTPARMESARPLELVLDARGKPDLRFGRPAPLAGASFLTVRTPEVPPYSFNGRIFIRIGNKRGYCSGTAINSLTRQLVLTAGHCVNAGAEFRGNLWFRDLLFVPAYSAGKAPFGAFPAKRSKVFAAPQWTNRNNADFDVGAFLTRPNNRGINVADAVGGGATIALDLTRRQRYASFGYPGNVKRLQGCNAAYTGDDRLSFPLPGPPTLGIGCQWAPGASGGAWLVDGTLINGLNSYQHINNRSRTYSPYFTRETVGKLVEGL
jgi:hypothetical protein